MTDEQIIKALEHCTKDYRTCNTCPQVDNGIRRESACIYEMLKEGFALIKRQQAEIDRLTTENERVKTKIYKMAIDKALAEKASAEAIKEFEEKLNSGFFRGHIYTGSYVLGLIEAIAKGMVGEGNA